MFYNVIIMPRAYNDIEDIYNYMLKKFKTEQSANKVRSKILKAIYSSDMMPERYRVYDNKPWESKNLRTMPINKYIICYLVDNDEKTESVIRVVLSLADIDRQLEYESGFYIHESNYDYAI